MCKKNHLQPPDFVLAILQQISQIAEVGIKKGENPFGAAVLVNQQLIESTHDYAVSSNNPAAHAEVVAIYKALRTLNTNFFPPESCLVSTCEPCPICISVAQLSGIRTIYFGMSVNTGKQRGYLKYSVPSHKFCDLLGSDLTIINVEDTNSTEYLIDFWEIFHSR